MRDAAASLLDLPAMLAANPRIGVLIALLVAAAVIDYRSYRIPNWLTAGGMLLGLACAALLPSPDHAGFLWAFGGLAVGFAVLLPLYVLRILGAGDVKLMAMAGAFLGAIGTLYAILFTFTAAGVLAVALALSHGALMRMLGNVKNFVQFMTFSVMGGVRRAAPIEAEASIGRMPYGISVATGTMAYLVAAQLGFA
ncbi:MAG TPA: A24 family peptidase [Ramlibacter sp.]|nr:A24 family peptidase [Ramlibacter sp.]